MNRSRLPLPSAALGDSTPKIPFRKFLLRAHGKVRQVVVESIRGAMVELPTTPPKHIERRA